MTRNHPVSAFLSLAISALAFAGLANETVMPVSETVKPGVWIGNFAAATNLAITTKTPMVMVWSSDTCPHCEALVKQMIGDEFVRWREDSSYVFCIVEGHVENYVARDKGENAGSGAFEFAATAAGTSRGQVSQYPIVCLYWRKGDGSVQATSFTGRDGKMPVKTGTLAEQVMASTDEYFTEYRAKKAWQFGVTDAPADRYEAEETTAFVDVKIVRDLDLTPETASVRLAVEPPAGLLDVETNEVAMAKGEVSRRIRIRLDGRKGAFVPGESIALKLLDADGDVVGRAAIHFVASMPNSPENPHWIGEYSAAELPWGEWTFDYSAALEKVQNGGYLLAMFSGVLWCPHCIGIEHSLFAADNEEFRQWAKDNKVALVLFDQPRAGKTAPRLLCEERDPNKTGEESVSGNYYLSRRMLCVDSDAVKAVNDRQARKTVDWLAPESTAARLSNPTILLIRKDETIAGRLMKCESAGNLFETDENLGRLDDFLLLDQEGDESQGYRSTTPLTLEVGKTASAVFQISERTKFFKLTNLEAGYVRIAKDETVGEPLALSVVAADGTVLASGTDMVLAKLRPTHVEQGVYLRAVAYADTTAKICAGGKTSRFPATFSAEYVPTGGSDEPDGPGFDAEGRPCLGWAEYAVDFWHQLTESVSFNVVNVEGARSVAVKRISGKLPAGLTLKYDRGTGRVVLGGTPTKALTEPVTVVYSVSAKIGNETIVGVPSSITISVAEPQQTNKGISKAWNVEIPMSVSGKIVGSLKVSQTARNKLSATCKGTESRALTFSGTWAELDELSGIATASLANRYGAVLQLDLDATGRLSASVSVPSNYNYFSALGEFSGSASVERPEDFSAYAGTYTVALPQIGQTTVVSPSAELSVPSGTASLKLLMTSKSAKRSGTVSYAGVLPTGKAFSGSASLLPTGEAVELVVFKRVSSVNLISARMCLAPDGEKKWADFTDDGRREIVNSVPGTSNYILHRQGFFEYLTEHDVVGSWYPNSLKINEIIQVFYDFVGQKFALNIRDEAGHGLAVAEVAFNGKKFCLVNKVNGLSFTCDTNGRFWGTVNFDPGTGTIVKGNFKGVFVPGWFEACGGCGGDIKLYPFGGGALWYNRKFDRKTVTEGLTVTLDAEDPDL